MKATSLFGGVQVFNILISIIRSKFIALLLGSVGMGIAGLFTSTTGLISGFTSFGLGTSAIKDISAASATGNQTRIATVVSVFNRLMWITGILGAILTIILSPWLSQLTFGNRDYTVAFIWLSITLLLGQLTSGKLVLLQGMRQLQFLAKANVIGSFLGLITTVPLYYFIGMRGIVPAIIIASAVSLVLSMYFSRKLNIEKIPVSRKETFAEGKNMLTMGFMISLSGLISLGASYVIRIYISRSGGVSEVGLYNAGFAIINTYVGLIFSAMGTDYYPRLSAVSDDDSKSRQVINQQAEISLLIIAPVLIVFLVFINWIVILLYSKQFTGNVEMIQWAAMGMFFKAASWSISFIFLAKGASKLFFLSELIANLYTLAINLLGYYFFGLAGIGIAFMVGYLLYFIQVFFISRYKFKFSFDSEFVKMFGIQVLLATVSFVAIKVISSPYNYLTGILLILSSTWYSFSELDKRIGLRTVIISAFNKYRNRE